MKNFSRLLVLSTALAAVSSAQAVLINVAANTTGSFAFTQNAGGLTYTGGSFDTFVDTAGGATSVGNSLNTTVDSLGLFRLVNVGGSPDIYAGTFSLTVQFVVPTTIPGSGTYSAVLSGAVTTVTNTNGFSTVQITFDDTDGNTTGAGALLVNKTFDYVDANGQVGTLTLGLNRQYNLGYNTTGNQTQIGVSGELTATATPGPSALAAFGVGALGAVRRRRRSAK
jgi:MYXO-CTERM domain-containing protein